MQDAKPSPLLSPLLITHLQMYVSSTMYCFLPLISATAVHTQLQARWQLSQSDPRPTSQFIHVTSQNIYLYNHVISIGVQLSILCVMTSGIWFSIFCAKSSGIQTSWWCRLASDSWLTCLSSSVISLRQCWQASYSSIVPASTNLQRWTKSFIILTTTAIFSSAVQTLLVNHLPSMPGWREFTY